MHLVSYHYLLHTDVFLPTNVWVRFDQLLLVEMHLDKKSHLKLKVS